MQHGLVDICDIVAAARCEVHAARLVHHDDLITLHPDDDAETCHLAPARWTARFVAEITGFQAPRRVLLHHHRSPLPLSPPRRPALPLFLRYPPFRAPSWWSSFRRSPRPFVRLLLSTIGMTLLASTFREHHIEPRLFYSGRKTFRQNDAARRLVIQL